MDVPSYAFASSFISFRTIRYPVRFHFPLIKRPGKYYRFHCTAVEPDVRKPARVAGTRSPSDLLVFRRSRFAAHLNELERRGLLQERYQRDQPSSLSEALIAAGRLQEERVLKLLRTKFALNVVSVPFGRRETAIAKTEALVREKTEVIHQAAVGDERLFGYVDLLIRDDLNPFVDDKENKSYSICEIKLASLEKGDYAIQAATYADLVSPLLLKMGLDEAKHILLWLGKEAEAPVTFQVNNVRCLYNSVRRDFDHFVQNFDENQPLPAPELGDCAPWNEVRDEILGSQDSLMKVAGMRTSQAKALKKYLAISTMRELAEATGKKSALGVPEQVFSRLQRQASLQVATESASPCEAPAYCVIEEGRNSWGLNKLPPLATRDIFFDMEGFPLAEHGVLDYLFGASTYREHEPQDGSTGQIRRLNSGLRDDLRFHTWWAHDRVAEESAFVSFIYFVSKQIEEQGTAHVYHYGGYEVSALRRLAARAETADGLRAGSILENLIDCDVFVDVYEIVRSGLQIGTPSYSIKQVEKLAGVDRSGDECADAQSSIALYHQWRVANSSRRHKGDSLASHILQNIERYNKQDCESLEAVVTWLRNLAVESGVKYAGPRETEDVPDDDLGNSVENKRVYARGTCGRSPEHKSADSAVILAGEQLSEDLLRLDVIKTGGHESNHKKTMAALLGYHVREGLPARAKFADRIRRAYDGDKGRIWSSDRMVDVRLSGIHRPSSSKSRLSQVYFHFDQSQPCALAPLDSAALVAPTSASGHVDKTSWIHGFVNITQIRDRVITATAGKQFTDPQTGGINIPRFGTLVSCDGLGYCPAVLRQSILKNIQQLLESDGLTDVPSKLLSNYLNREGLGQDAHISRSNFQKVVSNLKTRVIAVQGPPGSGKTSLMADLIRQLVVDEGKTVAVSSNSHAAIDNLLLRSIKCGVPSGRVAKVGTSIAKERQVEVDCGSVSTKSSLSGVKIKGLGMDSLVSESNSGKHVSARMGKKTYSVVGATAYALAAPCARLLFDYLIVDEAGQVPVANFVACMSCARSALLVGDQQQLEMPIQGVHPSGVGRSCLSYLVGEGAAVVSPRLGLFLDTSYRMTPQLCNFVSNHIYDGVLKAHRCASGNRIEFPSTSGKGMELVNADRGILFLSREQHASPHAILKESHCTGSNPYLAAADEDQDGDINSGNSISVVSSSARHSPTEVSIIESVVGSLLKANYFSGGDPRRPLTTRDILVVAPYNLQVRQLRRALHERFGSGIRVGTVDKFQGQEAAVAIVSVCGLQEDDPNQDADELFGGYGELMIGEESELEASRRGVEFVLSRNRLNVAVSRAECLAVVVGSEKLVGRRIAGRWGRTLEEVKMMSFYAGVMEEGMRNNRKRAVGSQSKKNRS